MVSSVPSGVVPSLPPHTSSRLDPFDHILFHRRCMEFPQSRPSQKCNHLIPFHREKKWESPHPLPSYKNGVVSYSSKDTDPHHQRRVPRVTGTPCPPAGLRTLGQTSRPPSSPPVWEKLPVVTVPTGSNATITLPLVIPGREGNTVLLLLSKYYCSEAQQLFK